MSSASESPATSKSPDTGTEGARGPTLLFPVSHGAADAERATLPFITAATAVANGHRAIVIATADAVSLGLPEVADGVTADGLPPLRDLHHQLVAGGGELWLSAESALQRGITGGQRLLPGTTIVGAARIVEALAAGRSLTLC